MDLRELLAYKTLFTDYGELRVQENTQSQIKMVGGRVVGNTTVQTSGVCARVFKNGYWGMASSPEHTKDGVYNVIRSARESANFLSGKLDGKEADLASNPGSEMIDYHTNKTKCPPKERLDFIKELDNYIDKKYSDLSSRTVSLSCFNQEKILFSADGGSYSVFLPRAHIYIGMTTDKDGSPIDLASPSIGGRGEFEDFFDNHEDVYKYIDDLYQELRRKKEGVFAAAGVKECILAPDLAGILAHEAVGHTVEADIVDKGSVALNLINKKVASNLISITDFAHTAFNETCPVPVHVDDEGTRAADVTLIENGILRNYMYNKYYAKKYGAKPLGNARAFSFSDEPLVRMRNTCILPGTSKLENMIASVEDGYYLCKPNNGQADTTGEFMFGITMGYEIKNGKLGRAILDTTVSGIAFDMLKTVSAVSDDLEWISSGFCGKKQPASVGMGGPAIQCKITVGGK